MSDDTGVHGRCQYTLGKISSLDGGCSGRTPARGAVDLYQNVGCIRQRGESSKTRSDPAQPHQGLHHKLYQSLFACRRSRFCFFPRFREGSFTDNPADAPSAMYRHT